MVRVPAKTKGVDGHLARVGLPSVAGGLVPVGDEQDVGRAGLGVHAAGDHSQRNLKACLDVGQAPGIEAVQETLLEKRTFVRGR